MTRPNPSSQMQARLQRVNSTAGARLDRLSAFFPPPSASALPFDEYVARASVQAQADPAFRDEFTEAMRKYRLAGQVLNASR